MAKIIRLTESDLTRIVRKVLSEQTTVGWEIDLTKNPNWMVCKKKGSWISQTGVCNPQNNDPANDYDYVTITKDGKKLYRCQTIGGEPECYSFDRSKYQKEPGSDTYSVMKTTDIQRAKNMVGII